MKKTSAVDIEQSCLKHGLNPSLLVHLITDLKEYEGTTLEEQVDALIQAHGVLIFSKSFCPFCLDVKDFFTSELGVPLYVLEVDTHPLGNAIHKVIKTKTNHLTVPAIFVKGTFQGGCEDIKALHATGGLHGLVNDLIVTTKPKKDFLCHKNDARYETSQYFVPVTKKQRGEAILPPFRFPATVDNNVIRLTGFFIFCVSISSIVYREEELGRWLSVGLLVDFILRFLGGSGMSPIALLATAIVTPILHPDFRAGPAKQFAAAVGILFTTVSTTCYFTDHEVPAAVVLGCLTFAAGLEAFGDVCLGCLVFSSGESSMVWLLLMSSAFIPQPSTKSKKRGTTSTIIVALPNLNLWTPIQLTRLPSSTRKRRMNGQKTTSISFATCR